MENQQKQQPDIVAGQEKKGKRGFVIGLIVGITAIGCGIIWLLFTDASSSRASTPSEIAAQEEFQSKLIKSEEEFQQKIDAARLEAEQTEAKSDSIRK